MFSPANWVRRELLHRPHPAILARSRDFKIVSSYWVLFAYCIGASLLVRLMAPALPTLVLLSFSGVILAAILISWGAEAAQFIVSQGLAIAIIALLQVVPEFMVEATIAWRREIDLMMANFTGSNRLLMGVGWALVFFTADIYNKIKTGRGISFIELRRETFIEVLTLMASSGYFFFVLAKRSLDITDGVVLAGPDPKTLIDPITPGDIRGAILGILQEWWFPMLEDPSWLAKHASEYHAFAVITMCRALHALEHGTIVSKPAAARWAQMNLGERWKQVIEQAISAQKPGSGQIDLLDDALELILYTKERINNEYIPL